MGRPMTRSRSDEGSDRPVTKLPNSCTVARGQRLCTSRTLQQPAKEKENRHNNERVRIFGWLRSIIVQSNCSPGCERGHFDAPHGHFLAVDVRYECRHVRREATAEVAPARSDPATAHAQAAVAVAGPPDHAAHSRACDCQARSAAVYVTVARGRREGRREGRRPSLG